MNAQTLSATLDDALRRHTNAQRDAAHLQDPDLSLPALERRRADLAAQARATFAAEVAQVRRDADALTHRHARQLDRVPAPQGSTRDAWERVRMLLDAGRSLPEVIATADADTLLAIREWAPTYLETLAPAPLPGTPRQPVDVAPLERSVRERWAQLKGDKDLTAALAEEPALAGLQVRLKHAEAVAGGNDHAAGLAGAVEAQLAEQTAARTLPAPDDAQQQDRP